MRNLKLTTHLKNGKEVNSYELVIDGEEFLYFNEMDLMAGFIARIGSGNTKTMEKATLLNTLFNVMLGEEYAKKMDQLKNTVDRLEARYSERILKLEREIAKVTAAIEKHDKLVKSIETIEEMTTKMTKGYDDACKPYEEYNNRIMKLEGDTTRIESHFKQATVQAQSLLEYIQRTVDDINKTHELVNAKAVMLVKKLEHKMQDMPDDDATDAVAENKAADGDSEGVANKTKDGHQKSATGKKNAAAYDKRKSARAAKPDAEAKPRKKAKKADDAGAPKTKRNSSRKKGDEYVLKEIENQAKENPNIK